MKTFNDTQLNNLVKAGVTTALREFFQQNKDIKIGTIAIERTELSPPGVSLHIVCNAIVLYSPEEEAPKE